MEVTGEQHILTDSFGRKHDYLRISLTERCNLRCTYCMPEEGIPLRDRSHFMTIEEIYEMAKIFVGLGVRKIRLTGGEPLIRKGLDELLPLLSGLGVELTLTTNGILVDRFITQFHDAGIKSINVSLDSLDPEKQAQLSRRNYFDKINNNIDLLLNEGFKVKLNMVVMKNVNDQELVDFVALTKEKPLDVRFIEFMPFSGNKWEWDCKGVGLEYMINQIQNHYGISNTIRIQDKPNDTSKNFRIKGHKGAFGIISTVTNPFCNTCNRIRLTADGKIKNCLFSSDETDLLGPLRKGEDVTSHIVNAIHRKKAVRAGMDELEDMLDPGRIEKNRSMISIGG